MTLLPTTSTLRRQAWMPTIAYSQRVVRRCSLSEKRISNQLTAGGSEYDSMDLEVAQSDSDSDYHPGVAVHQHLDDKYGKMYTPEQAPAMAATLPSPSVPGSSHGELLMLLAMAEGPALGVDNGVPQKMSRAVPESSLLDSSVPTLNESAESTEGSRCVPSHSLDTSIEDSEVLDGNVPSEIPVAANKIIASNDSGSSLEKVRIEKERIDSNATTKLSRYQKILLSGKKKKKKTNRNLANAPKPDKKMKKIMRSIRRLIKEKVSFVGRLEGSSIKVTSAKCGEATIRKIGRYIVSMINNDKQMLKTWISFKLP